MSEEQLGSREPDLNPVWANADSGLEPGESSGYPSRRPRIEGWTVIPWIIVLSLVGWIAWAAHFGQVAQKSGEITLTELNASKRTAQMVLALRAPGPLRDAFGSMPGGADKQAREFVEGMNRGALELRFQYAIMIHELDGDEAALEALDRIRVAANGADYEYTERQTEVEQLVRDVFGSDQPPAAVLTEPQQEMLAAHLGWMHNVLMHPPNIESAERKALVQQAVDSTFSFFGTLMAGLALIVVGLFVAGLMGYLAIDRLTSRMIDDSRCGPVYIETFAVWFVLFIVCQIGISLVPLGFVLQATVATVVPLVALAWPLFRGVSLGDLAADIGLRPANPIMEIFAGIVCYLATLPFLVAALIVSGILMVFLHGFAAPSEFAPQGIPHPLGERFEGGNVFTELLPLIWVAAVLAPITEEIIFRGVLYRHLRDATRHMDRWVSVIAASLLNGLLFAAIHPQGIVGLPLIATLGFSFCLARQWRGSLMAPMTMHALNNGWVTIMMWSFLQ